MKSGGFFWGNFQTFFPSKIWEHIFIEFQLQQGTNYNKGLILFSPKFQRPQMKFHTTGVKIFPKNKLFTQNSNWKGNLNFPQKSSTKKSKLKGDYIYRDIVIFPQKIQGASFHLWAIHHLLSNFTFEQFTTTNTSTNQPPVIWVEGVGVDSLSGKHHWVILSVHFF